MASELFVQARDTGLLGIIFSVAALPADNLQQMILSNDERRIVNQCSQCVGFLKTEGVHKNLLNVRHNKKLNVCRNIILNKNAIKTEALLKKFLQNVRSSTDHEKLSRIVSTIPSTYIHVPLASDTEWDIVSLSDTDNDSVSSGVSDYREW